MQRIIDQAIERCGRPTNAVGAVQLSFEGRDTATAVLTRQGGFANDQQVIQLDPRAPVTVTLATGRYAVAITSAGALAKRSVVTIDPCHTGRIHESVAADSHPALPFGKELEKLGLVPAGGALTELTLDGGEDIDLTQGEKFAAATHLAEITDVDRAKALFGTPDDRWPESFSRYGDLPEPKEADRAGVLADTMRHALREYISGNSVAVSAWKDLLNREFHKDPWVVPIYLFAVVKVGPCATLRVGAAGLWCERLQVHPTGTVKITNGPCHIHTSVYEGL